MYYSKKKLKFIFYLLSGLLFISSTNAQFRINGFADSYLAGRIKQPHDILSARNRLRMEMNIFSDNTRLFASFNAMKNYIIEGQDGIELREAYFDYIADNWDMRIGRQIII